MATQPQPTQGPDVLAFLKATALAIWNGFLMGIGLTLGYFTAVWLLARF